MLTEVVNACEKGQQWSHAIHLFTDSWISMCFLFAGHKYSFNKQGTIRQPQVPMKVVYMKCNWARK